MDLLASLLILCIATSSIGIGKSASSTFNVVDFGAIGDGKTDDTQAFETAWNASCKAEQNTTTLLIPGEKTFLLQSIQLRGPCKSKSLHVKLLGNIVAPKSIEAWTKGCGTYCWLCIASVTGLVLDGPGTIDGSGDAWWSKPKTNCKRPMVIHLHGCNNFNFSGITIRDSPGVHVTVDNCNGGTFSNVHINSPENSPNTDGICFTSSSHINISDSVIGTGDDCVCVNGGCSYINITGVACGPGHGISIGSLGDNGSEDNVEEVHVRNCTFTKTQNGARIKTFQGGSGYARKISYDEITLVASQHPIIIDQRYCPHGKCSNKSSSSVKISDVTFSSFNGTSATAQAITLDCSDDFGCFNITLNKINITSTNKGKSTSAYCNNAHGTSNSTLPEVSCLQNP